VTPEVSGRDTTASTSRGTTSDLAPDGGLWAVRCKCLPITDRAHFDSATDYIRDHEQSGAAVWEPGQTIDIDPGALLLD
jgi:hypothetical protein